MKTLLEVLKIFDMEIISTSEGITPDRDIVLSYLNSLTAVQRPEKVITMSCNLKQKFLA